MGDLGVLGMLSILLFYGGVILFVVSFTMFIRRILKNQAYRNDRLRRIEEKLDRLLEERNRT